MECPRCGEAMIHYRLGDTETWGCDRCRYSGVPVEHGSDRSPPESWDECLRRFYGEQEGSSVGAAQTDEAPGGRGASAPSGAPEAASSRCSAATNSGGRCSRDALEGERYCGQHLDMVERDGSDAVTDYE